MHRHDEIGARQQTAPAPQTLVGSLQPEAPFAKDSSDHSRCDTDEDQRTHGDHTPDKLGKHSEASQPLAGSGYLFAPRAPVPEFERQQEIELLRGAGADTIQLDEPWLSTMVDPAFCRREGIDDVSYEADRCVDLVNQVLDGIDDVATGMHLCHAHFERRHGTEGSYEPIMPALAKLRVGTISMEYATPASGGVGSLAGFPERARLGLGCIDHCDRNVETPDEVIQRVENAMRFVDKNFQNCIHRKNIFK